jgi:hypothetical protein
MSAVSVMPDWPIDDPDCSAVAAAMVDNFADARSSGKKTCD